MMTAYTDGACSGNPGPGGWGVLLIIDGQETELCGGEAETTNNRMELKAAIEALRALPKNGAVKIVTDSTYVKDGITSWMANWKRNGWKTAAKKEVLNKALWLTLDEETEKHKVKWSWVKAHSQDELNNEVDLLAREAAIK